MGSCCGCCSKKPKPRASVGPKNLMTSSKKSPKINFPKDSAVILASFRKQTVSGCPVNTRVKTNLFTRKELEVLKQNPQIDWRCKKIASPPFSDLTQIDEHLFLTGFWGLSKENIDKNHIKCIISITHEMPKFQIKGIECITLPVEDSLKEDLSIYFDDISDRINANRLKNIKTVIHCMAGARRSFTFVIAYLMKYKKMNLKTAFSYVYKKRRITISVNTYFFEQLIGFEKRLFGKNSVKMIRAEGQKDLTPDFIVKEFPELLNWDQTIQDESVDDTTISVISLA